TTTRRTPARTWCTPPTRPRARRARWPTGSRRSAWSSTRPLRTSCKRAPRAGRKRMLLPYRDTFPRLGARAFVAPDAVLVGDVTLGDDASVFFQSVLRADINAIRVGARTNIQDHCTV